MFPDGKCDSQWRTFSTAKRKSHRSNGLDEFCRRLAAQIQSDERGVLWSIYEPIRIEPLEQNANSAKDEAED
jgi:hypothetical protein